MPITAQTKQIECLEECPDLEGIETVAKVAFIWAVFSLEECPDLEGIETLQFQFNLSTLEVWRSAPT